MWYRPGNRQIDHLPAPLVPGYDRSRYATVTACAPPTAYARQEVIVSAGAYNTPKLLLLSGIGDCEHLFDVGIRCIVNSPGASNGDKEVAAGTTTSECEQILLGL